MFTLVFFLGFLALSALEVVPKFYQLAPQDQSTVLYVAETSSNDKTRQMPATKQQETRKDYQKLIQDIDPNGA